MIVTKKAKSIAAAVLILGGLSVSAAVCLGAQQVPKGNGSQMYRYSTTVEKERPTLDDVTKQLIAAYRRDPSTEHYNALRAQVAENYDKVVEKKKAKLEELRRTARDTSKITEMEDIVKEMIAERDHRIDQTMRHFTDARMRPGARNPEDGFVPVMGALPNVYLAYTPVTNAEYQAFVTATGHRAPSNWTSGHYIEGQGDYPVTDVTYGDAIAYCQWRSRLDGIVYRLPTEEEWELAAGHMPKDADRNCPGDSVRSVYAFRTTMAASGAIDMWGNVWEWTSTPRGIKGDMAVKGGSFRSSATDCRTENRSAYRLADSGYDDVGFRIVEEK